MRCPKAEMFNKEAASPKSRPDFIIESLYIKASIPLAHKNSITVAAPKRNWNAFSPLEPIVITAIPRTRNQAR